MESIETVSRKSFVFYRSFFDAVMELDEEDRLAAFEAIIRYALDGTEEKQNGAIRAIMSVIKPLLDVSRMRYVNGRKGGRPKNQTETKPKPNHNQTVTKPKPNVNVNVNENVNVNDNVGAQEGGHAPDPEEVKAYAASIGYNLDGQAFVDYYSARGWKISGEPIKDWRALVRRWKRQDDKPGVKKNGFHNFDERKEDLDAVTAERMRKQHDEYLRRQQSEIHQS